MQMKHMNDQNIIFWPTSAGLHENLLFIARSVAKGTFSTESQK